MSGEDKAWERANAITAALPPGVPQPEFGEDPDAELSLDWIRSRHRLVSVSVGAYGQLSMAWLDGTNSGHAVVDFDGVTVPPLLLEQLSYLWREEG